MSIVTSSLHFVQVQSDTAYIDSRVYCREVIQVDHGDWMRDTLQKHQTLIEQYFGLVRFETAYVNIPRGGKKDTKYALFTEAQVNFALTLSRNTPKTMGQKAQLIAEFEQAKAQLRSQLERQLQRQFATEHPIADNTQYNVTCWKVWRDSGIRDAYYVKNVIETCYDFEVVNKVVCVTQQTYEDLLENFRALDGADISGLPPEKQRKFRSHQEAGKMNRREPQKRDDLSWIQPSLF